MSYATGERGEMVDLPDANRNSRQCVGGLWHLVLPCCIGAKVGATPSVGAVRRGYHDADRRFLI